MKLVRWVLGSGLRVTMAVALGVSALYVAEEIRRLFGGAPGFYRRMELRALDAKLEARSQDLETDWKVVVAAADEKAIDAFGPLPWSREVYAALVTKLTQMGAGSIAFDITFDAPTKDAVSEALELFLQDPAVVQAPGLLQQTLEKLQPSSGTRGALEDLLGQFQGLETRLEEKRKSVDPDRRFHEAIAASGRVVLSLVSRSKREVRSLGLKQHALDRGLEAAMPSAVGPFVEPGGALMETVYNGRDSVRGGLYRTFFSVQAPTSALAAATSHFGTINAFPDADGVFRRVPLVSTIKGTGLLFPTLALKAVEVAEGAGNIEIVAQRGALLPERVRVGSYSLEPGLEAASLVDWQGSVPTRSIKDILEGQIPKEAIQDRIVFVAATAIGTHDLRTTAVGGSAPGVFIHATLAQNILDRRHLTRPPYVMAIELVVFLVVGLVAGLWMVRFHVLGQLVTAFLMVLGWLAFDRYVLFASGLVAGAVAPVAQVFVTLLAVVIWRFLVEEKKRRKTKRAFGQYLSPRVLELVLTNPDEYLKLGGRRYEATVLFSDIRGFTTISESLSPEDLGALLNRYMTPMTEIVFAHEGTLDKYIGDAVMAFWGAPLVQQDHALLACRAALKMSSEVKALSQAFVADGLPNIAIGIGLSSGPMTVGNMGSDDHFAYTALGDRVNLGARLEGQTKEYGVDIIISEACHALVKSEMLCRELGGLRVKGKREPVQIYELLGPHEACLDQLSFVRTFHRALLCYRARDWDQAEGLFREAEALGGGKDVASRRYRAWCQGYRLSPPPPDWDAVHEASTK